VPCLTVHYYIVIGPYYNFVLTYFIMITITNIVEVVVHILREDFEVSLHPYKTTTFSGNS